MDSLVSFACTTHHEPTQTSHDRLDSTLALDTNTHQFLSGAMNVFSNLGSFGRKALACLDRVNVTWPACQPLPLPQRLPRVQPVTSQGNVANGQGERRRLHAPGKSSGIRACGHAHSPSLRQPVSNALSPAASGCSPPAPRVSLMKKGPRHEVFNSSFHLD